MTSVRYADTGLRQRIMQVMNKKGDGIMQSEDSISIYSMNDLIEAYQAAEDSEAVLEYMSVLTGKSLDFLMEKIQEREGRS